MSLTLHPLWATPALLAALVILATLIFTVALLRRRTPHIRNILILPTVGGLCIAAALAQPILSTHHPAANITFLLDLSGSTRTSPWRNPHWLQTLAQQHLPPNTLISVVGFADTPRLLLDHADPLDSSRWPTVWPTLDPNTPTSLATALAWRSQEESEHNAHLAPRWIITDGLAALSTPPQPFPLAITEIPPPPTSADLAILHLQRSDSGELAIQLRATAPATGQLEIRRDQQLLATQQLTFTDKNGSTRWVTFQDADNHAPHHYEATITRTPTPDPWPENDHASLQWSPEESPHVLFITDRTTPDASPFKNLASEILPPAAFPTTLRTLLAANEQVIVLDSDTALSPQQLTTLTAFVRDTAGGLLLTSRVTPATDDPLNTLSPFSNVPPDRPPAHIVFLLDASGSMNESASPTTPDQKFRLAAQGVLNAVHLLHPKDQLTLLTFNDTVHALAAGTRQQLEPTLHELLTHVQPTGPTDPDAALPAITAAFANKPADAPALLILLTDGEIPTLDLPRWQKALAPTNVSLLIIAPRPQSADALSTLASTLHAHWYTTDDPTLWPTLLQRAVTDPFAGQTHTSPLHWLSQNLAPPLRGKTSSWQDAWLKPEALPLAVAEDHPLAAFAQRGLGKVAALAMPADADSALLQALLQKIAPPPGDRRITLAAHRLGNHWQLTADAQDHHHFLNDLHLHANLITADATSDQPLLLTAPGFYEATITSAHPFSAVVTSAAGHFVGTVQFPQLETDEWPASVDPSTSLLIPPDATLIDPTKNLTPWSPRINGPVLNLTAPCWLAAVMVLLMSVLRRRFG
jgi:hypothetical protein